MSVKRKTVVIHIMKQIISIMTGQNPIVNLVSELSSGESQIRENMYSEKGLIFSQSRYPNILPFFLTR